MCEVSAHLYKVFFYGTRQESLVKIDWIWSSHDNLETFSKKYGRKRDYCLALEEMKKKPDIFTVHDNDFCSHKCITCDQKRMNMKVEAIVKSSESTDANSFYHSLDDSSLRSMKNVKVVIKKTIKCVSDQEPKHETVKNHKSFKTAKKPKERIKVVARSSQENVFNVNKKSVDKEPNAEQMIQQRNIVKMENRKSDGIRINETVDKLKFKLNTKYNSTKTHFKNATPNISKLILKYKQNSKMPGMVQSRKSVKENPKIKQKEKQIRKCHIESKAMPPCSMKNNGSFEAESEKVVNTVITKHLKSDENHFDVEMNNMDNPDHIEKEAITSSMGLIDIDKIINSDDDALDLDVSYGMLDISQDNKDKSQGQNGETVDKGMKQDSTVPVSIPIGGLKFGFFTWEKN